MGSTNDNHYTTGAVAYSRRGSNPRPPAHKTGALPLSYWSGSFQAGAATTAGIRSRAKRVFQPGEEVRWRGVKTSRRAINKKVRIPDGIRTHNLRLRKPTPCPFGHWDELFTSSGTRTHNLTLRRGAPYPLGHGGLRGCPGLPTTTGGPLAGKQKEPKRSE